MTTLIVAFRNFAKAPKNYTIQSHPKLSRSSLLYNIIQPVNTYLIWTLSRTVFQCKFHTFFSVHATVHRNKCLYNKTNQMHQFPKFTPAWNSTCFGQFLCPSSGVYSLYTRHWYMSYRFVDSFRAECRVSCRSKFQKLVHLVGFYYKDTSKRFIDGLRHYYCVFNPEAEMNVRTHIQ